MKRIQDFWLRLNNFQNMTPDDARRGRVLNILLAGTFLLGILSLIATAIVLSATSSWDQPGNGLLILTLGIMVISSAFLFIINQRSVTFASFLFLFVLTIAISFSDSPLELARGRSTFVFFIPIAISSLLLTPASSFFFALITAGIILWLESIAAVPVNVPILSGLIFLALISWLSARSLEQALRDLRIINANLDNLVTERTEALSESLTRERIDAGRNQAILNSIADGVIVFNAENVAILANPALGDLTEIQFQNLSGMNLNVFSQSKGLSLSDQRMITRLIEHPEKREARIRVEWGQKFLSVGVASVLDTTTNENIGTVAVFRDVTRETELEKMKENFVAVVSHELRTPLNAILGLTEMLKEGIYGPLNDRQTSITERVMVNARRLLSMVGDLLDEAQISAGKLSIRPQVFKTVSLLENLHSTMDKIAADKGLSLSSELDPKMPEIIKADPQRLQQVLINLVNNAVKFTEKGSVHVHIIRSETDYWKIVVTDTGIGISENEIPHIFETFRQADNMAMTTRQYGGFGLGLSIVKQLVELMNGKIQVKSEKELGSTFTIVLPLEIG